nr:pre-mRNA-splicing factor SYF1 [Tanacetum cinerariifolium]
MDLRIATPQIIINYATLLEDHKYFEDAFKVYERGVKIFKYPHVKDIWVTYLSKFVTRYGNSKLERCRELFNHAVKMAPAEVVKPLYLQYAKLEEDFGLAKKAMEVYDRATKAVPASEQLSMYEIYIAHPRFDVDFLKKWHEFEVNHGNEYTFRNILRIKRSVSARHSQTHVFLPEYLQKPSVDEAMDQLKRARVPEDEMEALERQLAPKEDSAARKLGFVSYQEMLQD